MYLPQAASLPQLLGIERDLFRCRQLVEEVQLELAVVGCSVVVPPLAQQTVGGYAYICQVDRTFMFNV